ncbi:hypothetical protein BV25DRAFT_233653 [Artomyces pyxidatus]|uniref:Uncharacterized protein n=1 Tax=Artomyces pyxidatus TaxID=48021 RepID=A0ACB8SH45_9AGAM|nr:hypothetical protein BV25DRAFT_233653 [Artomyces pyxidatus]
MFRSSVRCFSRPFFTPYAKAFRLSSCRGTPEHFDVSIPGCGGLSCESAPLVLVLKRRATSILSHLLVLPGQVQKISILVIRLWFRGCRMISDTREPRVVRVYHRMWKGVTSVSATPIKNPNLRNVMTASKARRKNLDKQATLEAITRGRVRSRWRTSIVQL